MRVLITGSQGQLGRALQAALANVNAAGLGIELRPWREALEEHLGRSRSESGAAAPARQVNR
jgi:nucleoside-diphosphate-sugar epimerase